MGVVGCIKSNLQECAKLKSCCDWLMALSLTDPVKKRCGYEIYNDGIAQSCPQELSRLRAAISASGMKTPVKISNQPEESKRIIAPDPLCL